jgi:S1-C subfamily serine protease
VTRADWLAIAFVALSALLGWRKGLVGSAFSVVGIVAGAILGARLAPHLLADGDQSPYTPLVGLLGAAVGAIALEALGSIAARAIRTSMRAVPSLRFLDTSGGIALGAAAGITVVWVAGAVALNFPGQTELRRDAQRSLVLRQLNGLLPPERLMEAIERVDPFPTIAGPLAPVDPPDPTIPGRPGVRAAEASVVRVFGNACGLAVSGSGWVAAPGLVVTAAHVVAGESESTVQGGDTSLPAHAVAFDPRNDVAVLRVTGSLGVRPLRLGDASPGEPVAILGYPGNGPFTAAPGRIGRTTTVLSEDAYGRGPVTRTITSLRGLVRHGNSGGPAVNAKGEVEATVFAARIGSEGGFGVPPSIVRSTLEGVRGPVSTGDCAR